MAFVQVNHRVLQYFPGYGFFRVLNIVSVVPRPGQALVGDGLVAYGNIARY